MIEKTGAQLGVWRHVTRGVIARAILMLAVLAGGAAIAQERDGPRSVEIGTARLGVVAASSDGRLLAVGGVNGRVIVTDRETGAQIMDAAGHLGRITHLRFAEKADVLTSFGDDGSLQVWDVASRQRRYSLPVPSSRDVPPALSADGAIAVVAGRDSIQVWSIERGYRIAVFPLPAAPVRLLAFSPDNGQLVFVVLADGHLATIDVAKRQLTLDTAPSLPRTQSVLTVPDGRGLIALGDDGAIHGVRLAERRSGRLEGQIAESTAMIAIAGDSRRVAFMEPEGRISVWDIGTQARIAQWQAPGITPTAIAMPGDGRTIMLAGRDGIVCFLAADSGVLKASIDLDQDESDTRFLSDRHGLVSVSNSTLTRWNTSPDGLAAIHAAAVDRLRSSADKLKSVIAGREERYRALAAEFDELIEKEGPQEARSWLARIKEAEAAGDMAALEKLEVPMSSIRWEFEQRRRLAIALLESRNVSNDGEIIDFYARIASLNQRGGDKDFVLESIIEMNKASSKVDKLDQSDNYQDLRWALTYSGHGLVGVAGGVRDLASVTAAGSAAGAVVGNSSKASQRTSIIGALKSANANRTVAEESVNTKDIVVIGQQQTVASMHDASAAEVAISAPSVAASPSSPRAYSSPAISPNEETVTPPPPATGGLPRNALYMRRNNQFGSVSTTSVQELINNGELIDQTLVRFDDFVPQKAVDIPKPAAGQALLVSHGLNPIIADGEEGEVGDEERWYLEVALRTADAPPPASPAKVSPPVNYVFVVDVSGSMEGTKLDQAKMAIRQLLGQMKPDDSIGIVSFSESPTTVVEATRVKDLNQAAFARSIAGMKAEGGTDLMMGTLYGIAEARKYQSLHGVSRIFLFSDGEPTSGETVWLRIRQTIKSELRGLSLSTLAFGTNAQFEELDRLAGFSGGRYAAVSDAGELAAFLVRDIGRRDYLAAMNIQAKITIDPTLRIDRFFGHDPITSPALQRVVMEELAVTRKRLEENLGIKPGEDIVKDQDGMRVFIPDLAYGETYILLLEVSAKKGAKPDVSGQFTVTYADIPDKKSRKVESGIGPRGNISAATIAAHGAQMKTSEVLYAATEDLYRRDVTSARARLDQQASSLRRISFSPDAGVQSIQIRNIISTLDKMSFQVLNLGKPRSGSDSGGGLQMRTIHAMNMFGQKGNGFIQSAFSSPNPMSP